MKNLLMILLLTVFTAPAFARTTTVNGYGRETGYCSGVQGNSCIRYIQDRAEIDGGRDAEWRCRANGGQSRSYSTHCNTSCFPNYIRPDERSTPVRCSATCSMQCEI